MTYLNKIPKKIVLTKGVGVGSTNLNSFDSALLNAGVGNLNLVKVSSIIPSGAKIINISKGFTKDLPLPGSLTPAVYSFISSSRSGERITAVLVVGIPKNKKKSGIIFELARNDSFQKAKRSCEKMIKEAFRMRGIKLDKIFLVGDEAIVKDEITTVIAIALLI